MKKGFKTFLAVIMLIPCLFLFFGCDGFGGGKSAYEIAVANGFVGTEEEWINSLTQGKSAYEIAVEHGFEGTEIEWLASLKGEKGDSGDDGMGDVVAKCITSVVSVVAKSSNISSNGSGVIIQLDKANGNAYIVTNYHVVYYQPTNMLGGSAGTGYIYPEIKLYLYGMEYNEYAIDAIYLGGSVTNDMAVLKVTNSDTLKSSNATVANYDYTVYAGDSVVAIGNPLSSGIAATKGIVSVDSEEISLTLANKKSGTLRVMRIDAAVNEGNSGGGLFNADGKLIGIVNAKIEKTGVEGTAYAIPSLIAVGIAQNVIAQETSSNVGSITPQVFALDKNLGVELGVEESIAQYNSNLKVTEIISKIEVESVASGLAYGKLRAGDVLISLTVKGKEVALNRDYLLGDYMWYFKSGDTVRITVNRGGVQTTVSIVLTGNPTSIS